MTRCQKCQKGAEWAFGTFGTPLDCVSRNSRLLPQCRVEAQPCGRPPAGLDRLDPQPTELLEHRACAIDLFGCRKLGPVPAVDGAGRVPVAHVPLADTLQQSSGSLYCRVLGRGVEPFGVGLKVFAPGCGLKRRLDAYSPSIPRAVHELDELEDECKGGHKGTVFGQMALQGRGKLCRAQPDLKFIPPLVEDLLGTLGEPHGGYTFLIFAARAEVLRVQGIEPLEDVVGPVLRLKIWPTVHVLPSWVRIGPHQQLEALEQAVIALLSLGGLVDVAGERSWLDA